MTCLVPSDRVIVPRSLALALPPAWTAPDAVTGGQAPAQAPEHVEASPVSLTQRYTARPEPSVRNVFPDDEAVVIVLPPDPAAAGPAAPLAGAAAALPLPVPPLAGALLLLLPLLHAAATRAMAAAPPTPAASLAGIGIRLMVDFPVIVFRLPPGAVRRAGSLRQLAVDMTTGEGGRRDWMAGERSACDRGHSPAWRAAGGCPEGPTTPRILSSAGRSRRSDLAGGGDVPQTGAHERRQSERGAAMTTDKAEPAQWTLADEGWGRAAADFAALSEPSNCREYVALHHRLGVDAGDRLLDVACGSGLALELARLRGAECAGIDASPRLVAVARDRSPGSDIRVGDMNALPWEAESFDVVTSFRGIWGTTPGAVGEIHRVLRPGGRVGITVWGHIKVSPGAWALAPLRLAAQEKVGNQAAMVSLGRPGAGEELLAARQFTAIERIEVPFALEFADPELYARAIASTGPAYEAIQHVGADAFRRAAVEQATGQLRDGLPLRAEIKVVGYLARKAEGTSRA